MTSLEIIDLAIKGSMGALISYGVHVLSGMKKSIDDLNKNMSEIIERTKWHSKEIDRIDSRLERLETLHAKP